MNTEKHKRIHFHTFDSLRFISFFLVFLHHAPIPETNFLHLFSKAGGIGVSFFFVLSGFLITYILILEKLNNNNRVLLKPFFKRRILRIWPLYYAMVLFAFCSPFVLRMFNLPFSDEGYKPNWFFTVSFLENYVMMYKNSFPDVSPLRVMWSLCIEEHFYIIWGVVFYFITLRNIPKLIVLCLAISFVSKIIYEIYDLSTLDILTNIEQFASGAIPAYIFIFHKNIILKLETIPAVYKYIYAVIVLLTVVLISNSILCVEPKYSAFIFGILFSVLILTTLGQRNTFKISDRSIMARLGKYTYGLYLIHTICIILFSKLGDRFGYSWYIIVILSFFSTTLLSYLSYHLFEKQFLKLKN